MHDQWMDDPEAMARQLVVQGAVCLAVGVALGLFIGWLVWA